MSQTPYALMIVEDEQDLRDIYSLKFTNEGFQVITASNGAEALQLLEQGELPDVMLLDVVMPVMDGIELLSRIKSHETFKTIPVFILSNLGQDSNIEEGLRHDAAKYLIKANYTPQEVVDKVREYLATQKNAS